MWDKEKKLSNSTKKLVLHRPTPATVQVVFAEKIFKFQCYKVTWTHSKTCCIQSNDFSPGRGANPLRFVIEKIFNLPVYVTLYDSMVGKIPVYKCTLCLNLAIRNDYSHSKHVLEYEFREATTDEIWLHHSGPIRSCFFICTWIKLNLCLQKNVYMFTNLFLVWCGKLVEFKTKLISLKSTLINCVRLILFIL